MYYGLHGKMVAKPGKREAVVEILRRDLDDLRTFGCRLYVVSLDVEQEDTIWVTEVWDNAEGHTASLQSPRVRATIAEAMPLLTGEFSQTALEVAGGLGLPA